MDAEVLLITMLQRVKVDPAERETVRNQFKDALAVDPELNEAFKELIATDAELRSQYESLLVK